MYQSNNVRKNESVKFNLYCKMLLFFFDELNDFFFKINNEIKRKPVERIAHFTPSPTFQGLSVFLQYLGKFNSQGVFEKAFFFN